MSTFVGGEVGMGTIVKPGDPFFTKNDDHLTGMGFSASKSFGTGNWRHVLSLGYSSLDGEVHKRSPYAGDDIGYVPSDADLGAGVNFGDTGVFARSRLSLTTFDVSYKATQPFHFVDGQLQWGRSPAPDNPLRKSAGLVVSFRKNTLDHDGYLELVNSPDAYNVKASQSIDSFDLGVGPTVSGKRDLGAGYYVWGSADAQLIYRYSTLDSYERICAGCPGNSDMSRFDDDKSSVDGRLTLQAAIGRQFAPNIGLKVTGGLEFGGRDVLDVRRTPNDKSTHIGHAAGVSAKLGMQFVYRFDPPFH